MGKMGWSATCQGDVSRLPLPRGGIGLAGGDMGLTGGGSARRGMGFAGGEAAQGGVRFSIDETGELGGVLDAFHFATKIAGSLTFRVLRRLLS